MKPARGRIPLREQMRMNRAAMRAMCTTQGQLDALERDFPEPAAPKPRAARKPSEGLSELQEQIRVIKWWDSNCERWGYLPVHLFHVPNGGSRGEIESVNLKRSGVRPGVPDLFLAVPVSHFHGMFIEMKSETGRFDSIQEATMFEYDKQGYRCVVAYGHEEAIASIGKYFATA